MLGEHGVRHADRDARAEAAFERVLPPLHGGDHRSVLLQVLPPHLLLYERSPPEFW